MTRSLKCAFVCGAAPLGLSTLVLLTWLGTGYGGWERAWLWLIGLGIACLLIGTICLLAHNRRVQADPAAYPRRWLYPGLAGALLLLNLPVGALYMFVALNHASRYTIVVVNLSDQVVESLVLNGPGIDSLELGPISGKRRASTRLEFTGDGKLVYSGRCKGQVHSGILDGSANPISGGGKQLLITEDGFWQIQGKP